MKVAPVAALSLGVKLTDMSDDESINIEIDENPTTIQPSNTFMDLVVHTVTKEVLYMKSQGAPFDFLSSIFGNEKALNMFEAIIEKKSNDILSVLTHQQK
jgi:hypothetical protein